MFNKHEASERSSIPSGCSTRRIGDFRLLRQNKWSLGDEFWEELNAFIDSAAANPQRFHFDEKHRRRVNLSRFPYHFLFREIPGGIRITVVRHHRHNPEFGSRRT